MLQSGEPLCYGIAQKVNKVSLTLEHALLGHGRTLDRVHDSQLGDAVERIADEVKEVTRLTLVADQVRGADGQRRIARPRVTVVPVPGAPQPLRQRGRGRSHDRAGSGVDQQLQRECGAQDVMSPGTIVLELP